MQLNVFFLPSAMLASEEAARDVYIVIDVIRATTSMAVMFDRGARRIFAAGTIEQARRARALYPQRLLCGERNGKPLPDFAYGNSPRQFAAADLHECELIMTTTNGTRAFHACPANSTRLAGSLYNAEAVAARALEMAAEHRADLHLVCSGALDAFALDDAVCAGYLTQEIQRQAEARGCPLALDESALAALALYAAYPPSALCPYSYAAQAISQVGLADDLPLCMSTNVSQSVGMVVGQEETTGLLVVERA